MGAKVLHWLFLMTLAAAIAVTLLNRDRLGAAALEPRVSAAGAAGRLLFVALCALALLGTLVFLRHLVVRLRARPNVSRIANATQTRFSDFWRATRDYWKDRLQSQLEEPKRTP